jgi:hypothetical protein
MGIGSENENKDEDEHEIDGTEITNDNNEMSSSAG